MLCGYDDRLQGEVGSRRHRRLPDATRKTVERNRIASIGEPCHKLFAREVPPYAQLFAALDSCYRILYPVCSAQNAPVVFQCAGVKAADHAYAAGIVLVRSNGGGQAVVAWIAGIDRHAAGLGPIVFVKRQQRRCCLDAIVRNSRGRQVNKIAVVELQTLSPVRYEADAVVCRPVPRGRAGACERAVVDGRAVKMVGVARILAKAVVRRAVLHRLTDPRVGRAVFGEQTAGDHTARAKCAAAKVGHVVGYNAVRHIKCSGSVNGTTVASGVARRRRRPTAGQGEAYHMRVFGKIYAAHGARAVAIPIAPILLARLRRLADDERPIGPAGGDELHA